MTPQEKAKDIYDQMKGFRVKNSHRKKCALKTVEEIIKSNDLENYPKLKPHLNTLEFTSDDQFIDDEKDTYWQKVKTEIENF